MKLSLYLLAFLLLVGAKSKVIGYTFDAEVIKVLDGDTIDVKIWNWHKQSVDDRIRIYALDTPEKKFPLGKIVKQYAIDTIAVGSKVKVTIVGVGKFGRTLANVSVDGEDWTQHLIEKDYGRPYFGGSKEGLWSECELEMSCPS